MTGPDGKPLPLAEAARDFLTAGERLFETRALRPLVSELLALYLAGLRAQVNVRRQLAEAKERDEQDSAAGRLIDAWCADKGAKIPWAKAVQIVAIVTKQSAAERDRLLRMGDEDGSCGMCGRNDAAQAERDRLRAREYELVHAIFHALDDGEDIGYGTWMIDAKELQRLCPYTSHEEMAEAMPEGFAAMVAQEVVND